MSTQEGKHRTLLDTATKVLPAKPDILFEQYKKIYRQSIENPKLYWGNAAKEHLDWFRPFDKVVDGGFEHGDVRWFEGGKLNLSYNALDRHVNSEQANDLALIWEGDEPSDIRKLTYDEVLRKVCQISNAMIRMGVQKGDIVTIYMPMIPELAMTMLAW
jgi:acetyl-CoA synthetase